MSGYVKFARTPLDPRLAKLPTGTRWLYHRLVVYACWEDTNEGALLDDKGKPMSFFSMERISGVSRRHIPPMVESLVGAGLLLRNPNGLLSVADYGSLYRGNGLQPQPEERSESPRSEPPLVANGNVANGYAARSESPLGTLRTATSSVANRHPVKKKKVEELEEGTSTSLARGREKKSTPPLKDPFADDEAPKTIWDEWEKYASHQRWSKSATRWFVGALRHYAEGQAVQNMMGLSTDEAVGRAMLNSVTAGFSIDPLAPENKTSRNSVIRALGFHTSQRLKETAKASDNGNGKAQKPRLTGLALDAQDFLSQGWSEKDLRSAYLRKGIKPEAIDAAIKEAMAQ